MGMINLPNQVFLLYFLWNEAFEKETYFTNNHIKFNETVIGFKQCRQCCTLYLILS